MSWKANQTFLKKPYTYAIVAIIFIGILMFWTDSVTSSQHEFFRKQLSTFILPAITVQSSGLTITDSNTLLANKELSDQEKNTILRIAHYSVSHRLNPIFAMEGTDPDLFEVTPFLMGIQITDHNGSLI